MHTPGPWKAEDTQFWSDNGEAIGECYSMNDGGVITARDNANLISAAPELLEVAEWIIGKWKNGHHMPPDLLLKARQAIVKAKGE